MATTRVPEVVDALLALVAAALPDVQVTDGHPGPVDLNPDVVSIAAGGDQGWSVEVTQTHDDALCDPTETGAITCGVSSWRGDIGMKPVRDRAAELLAAFEDVIRDDRTLGAVVDWCEFTGDMWWALRHTSEGSAADVGFRVQYRAYL